MDQSEAACGGEHGQRLTDAENYYTRPLHSLDHEIRKRRNPNPKFKKFSSTDM